MQETADLPERQRIASIRIPDDGSWMYAGFSDDFKWLVAGEPNGVQVFRRVSGWWGTAVGLMALALSVALKVRSVPDVQLGGAFVIGFGATALRQILSSASGTFGATARGDGSNSCAIRIAPPDR